MTQDIAQLKTHLTDQKQDVMNASADLRFLSGEFSTDGIEIDIEGFEPSALTKDNAFQSVYKDPLAREVEHNHRLVLSCLDKLKTVERIFVAQDRLQWLSQNADEVDAIGRDQHTVGALLQGLAGQFHALREQQDNNNAKPDIAVLRDYSDRFMGTLESHAGYLQKTDAQRRGSAITYGKRHGGTDKITDDIWQLRTEFLGASVTETGEQMKLVQDKLVQVVAAHTALDRKLINSTQFVQDVTTNNLAYCDKALMRAKDAHQALDELVGQLENSEVSSLHNGSRRFDRVWAPMELGAVPLITP